VTDQSFSVPSMAEASGSLGLRAVGQDARSLAEFELGLAGQPAALGAVSWVTPEYGVSVVCELGSGQTIQVGPDLLQSWGTSLDEVVPVALQNGFGREVADIERFGEGCYAIQDEQMVASVLLRPSILDGFAVSGRSVVMVPATGVLLLAGDADPVALGTMLELAGEVLEQGEKLVGVDPLVRVGDGWEPFAWSRVPALVAAADVLAHRWAAVLYDWQRPLLQESYQRNGVDRFVASLSTMEVESGGLLSYTSWTEGVDAVLPKADLVVFIPDDGPPVRAEWDAVVRAVRGQLEPVGIRPERFRVTDFPKPRVLKRIALR
jgi:hypothetical protein